jgi:hypothetical protein
MSSIRRIRNCIILLGVVILFLNTSILPVVADTSSCKGLLQYDNENTLDEMQDSYGSTQGIPRERNAPSTTTDPEIEVRIRGGYSLSIFMVARNVSEDFFWRYWVNLSLPFWSAIRPGHPVFNYYDNGAVTVFKHAQSVPVRFCFGTFSVEFYAGNFSKKVSGILFGCTLLIRGYIILERDG